METNNLALTLDSILQEANKAADSLGSSQRFSLPLPQDELERLLTNYYESCVRYRNRKFIRTNEVSENIHKVAGWLRGLSIKPMLMLLGNVGTGKTMLAQSINQVVCALGDGARKLEKENRSRNTTSQHDPDKARLFSYCVRLTSPLMCTAQSLCDMVVGDHGYDRFARFKKSNFLIVDDLGVEPPCVKVYGDDKYPLVELINDRYAYLRTTVFTSNLYPDDISKYYGVRIADRLEEVCERIIFRGDSFRRK